MGDFDRLFTSSWGRWNELVGVPCRRAVPLAIALLNVSNPDMTALDTLSRLSHDADPEVAQCAVLALGAWRRMTAAVKCWPGLLHAPQALHHGLRRLQ